MRRPAHVRSATRLQVGAFDLDRAQNSGALHFLAHAHLREFFLRAVAHVDRTVFENDAVGRALRTFEDFESRFRTANVDRTQFGAKVKRNRWAAESLLKHRREQVLAGVLLHVIETARPIDAAVNRAQAAIRDRRCE